MLKRILVFACLFWNVFLFSNTDLPLYKETEHFQVYSLEEDHVNANLLVQDLEQYWEKWNKDLFQVSFSGKVKLEIFPDAQSFYKQADSVSEISMHRDPNRPAWMLCMYNEEENSIYLVSPQSQPYENSIIKTGKLCLGWFFMYQKYNYSPFWLNIGIPYCETKIYSKDMVDQYLLNENKELTLPLLTQHEDPDYISKRPDLLACNIFAEFLIDQWGMDTALTLLEDYSSFEEILGISKEEFHAQCLQYLKQFSKSVE